MLIQGPAAYLALALMTAPAMAQDYGVIEACSKAAIGSEACDRDDLADSLGLLGINDVRVFKSVGMESFAMLTAMRHGAAAMFFLSEDEGCIADEERTAAVEIWSLWVQLPDDAPGAIKDKYALFDGVMNGIIDMEVGC